MSFDVFFQRFYEGDAVPGGNVEARRVLEPYLVSGAGGNGLLLQTTDGSAEVYGLDTPGGFMATHVEGRTPWDVLVEAASSAGFAIMPVGCPVCVPTSAIADDLPAELVQHLGVAVVSSGEELLAVIARA